ncbi:MAG: DUF5611 family protein [Euryarchaeota archaeon]|nr:DUF5611 family protein [Euryarchaeota archaeon]MDE1836218.1 DUF5611 family protein [Euryarchaeota archaeon]MDE1880871.1 DUF5611 family protein [Euryarchaeota archaeon]MDE2045021.1 DUF5611 family protein [Thermoplasmata archaeon]
MQKYPVSPKVVKSLSLSTLQSVLQEVFGNGSTEEPFAHASFGALKDLKVGFEGKSMLVETVMDPTVPSEVQQETIRRYNSFLERATGYTAKERAKKLQQAAKKGGAEA